MITFQQKSAAGEPIPAQRGFTRAHNDLYDRVKPELYHKVDRSVLDALVRRLEGYHQQWVGLTIAELAQAAGVSNWSTTKALGRLAAAEVILRRRRKLTKSGRFIWEIALSDAYRVTGAPMRPSHGTLTCERPMPLKEKMKRHFVHHHESGPGQTGPLAPAPDPPDTDDDLSALAEIPSTTSEVNLSKPAGALVTKQRPQALEAAHPMPETTPDESKQVYQSLRAVGIDHWKALQLARSHPKDLINQSLATLKYRVGTIRNAAAWLVREIERGGYAPPPQLTEQLRRDAEQAERERQRQAEKAHQQALQQAQDQQTKSQLQAFHALSPLRQQQLLDQVRERLRRISPRLLQEPLDLTTPGPVRSQLLELLAPLNEQTGLRTATATPRSGGWHLCRRESVTGLGEGKVST